MQLVNMDVENHENHTRTVLGPFSPGLNAVFGPRESGKSTLLNWLRRMAAAEDREPIATRLDSPSLPIVGNVEFANRGQRVRIRGDRNGRRQVENGNHDWLHGAADYWSGNPISPDPLHRLGSLSIDQRNVFGALISANSEGALEAIAVRCGFSDPAGSPQSSHEQLSQRQREVELRLRQFHTLPASRETLLTRRRELEAELLRLQHRGDGLKYDGYPMEYRRFEDRLSTIEADLRDTLAQIDELDRELTQLKSELKVLELTKSSVEVGDSYRAQLQQIDDRLNRWRQTLRDLKSHRDRVEHEATDARLDREVGDQLSLTKEPDPRAALRSLESQILSARKQLDSLVDRYSVFQDRRDENPSDFSLRKDSLGRTHLAYSDASRAADTSSLPETLRSMQKDLYEACQQLARHESRAATETLKQQSQQLQRCETELLHSVEKLIEERAVLLRKIADEYQLSAEQLSLSFGTWCECHDHHHLQDWLLNEADIRTPRSGPDPLARQRMLEAIDALEHKRKTAALHVEDCRRQLRDSELHRRGLVERRTEPPQGRAFVEVERELFQVNHDLQDWEQYDRLQAEASEILRQLSLSRPQTAFDTRFRDIVNRHIVSLMGGRERIFARRSDGGISNSRRYDLVDGLVYDNVHRIESEVPPNIVRTALRLAIAASMSARSEPIPVLLDCELDNLSPEIQESAVAHLARVSVAGQQVIIMTAQESIVDLVGRQHGWVGSLRPSSTPVPVDVNRHLAALANDYEADKWTSPQVPPVRRSPVRGEFYLTERSRIEESPSIDAVTAQACRHVGVELIGDLFDVDPYWLADQIRNSGVTGATVAGWQAESRLLCGVRQLRPFDARLLVSVGVHTPQQLADMHPSELLERVERFVSTDRGRRFLRSGSSYELSRITTWIASANGGTGKLQRSNFPYDGSELNGRSAQAGLRNDSASQYDNPSDFAVDGYESQDAEYDSRDFGSHRQGRTAGRHARSSNRNGSHGFERPARRDSERPARDFPILGRNVARPARSDAPREERQRNAELRSQGERKANRPLKLSAVGPDREESARLKFYLELSSPVVDAPSIGPRMATRLEKFGIFTVDQLFAANADSLADKLNLRRIDAETIRAWQEQSRLVCRIPNLRGHDAQLLVACNLTSPEELATLNPASVLAQVLVVAESVDGQRILRGSKQPDLAEVHDWIAWASQSRSLHAA